PHSCHFFSNRSIALGRELMKRRVIGCVRGIGLPWPPAPPAAGPAHATRIRPAGARPALTRRLRREQRLRAAAPPSFPLSCQMPFIVLTVPLPPIHGAPASGTRATAAPCPARARATRGRSPRRGPP